MGFGCQCVPQRRFKYFQSPGLLNAKKAFEVLEPCAGKLASSVLRGRSGSNATLLPDFSGQMGDTRCRHNISNYKYTKENFYDPAVNKPPLIPYYINDYRVDLSSFI